MADYLQIPVGIGQGNYYDFNLNEFIKNFELDVFVVINTLKMLEQEGYINFNETVFLPSTVGFSAPKELLGDFEQAHPQLEPVMKCLLRTYEGIYDNKVSINEKLISRLTKISLEEVKQKLQHLRSYNIIEYEPQKETPQIYFITNRASAEYLVIDHEKYKQRKDEFAARVNTVLNYLQTTIICRSKFIGNYFGDTEIDNCGICDNCLKKRSSTLNEEEFITISQRILDMLNDDDVVIQNVLQSCKNIRQEKLWIVLDHLQSERIIRIETDGKVKYLR